MVLVASPAAAAAAGRQTCSQVLLTLENLADRSQYINARNTFTELLAYDTIPVVNENVRSIEAAACCVVVLFRTQV